MPRQVNQCPVCDAPLRVTELSCAECDTKLHGVFPAPPLARLSREHQEFVETFVLCRGVIRDVEKMLGVSYPTVRARLDAAVSALEAIYPADGGAAPSRIDHPPFVSASPETARRRQDLLRQVEDGLLDPAEAAEALRQL